MRDLNKNRLMAAAGLVSALFSNLVFAHPGHDLSVSFMSGLLHPFSGCLLYTSDAADD